MDVYRAVEPALREGGGPKGGAEGRADRLIVSVFGTDHPGIVAAVSQILAEARCSIIDINQTVVQGKFAMVIVADIARAGESVAVLGTPDAYHLPPGPGAAQEKRLDQMEKTLQKLLKEIESLKKDKAGEIKSAADFKGKRIGVTAPGSSTAITASNTVGAGTASQPAVGDRLPGAIRTGSASRAHSASMARMSRAFSAA